MHHPTVSVKEVHCSVFFFKYMLFLLLYAPSPFFSFLSLSPPPRPTGAPIRPVWRVRRSDVTVGTASWATDRWKPPNRSGRKAATRRKPPSACPRRMRMSWLSLLRGVQAVTALSDDEFHPAKIEKCHLLEQNKKGTRGKCIFFNIPEPGYVVFLHFWYEQK